MMKELSAEDKFSQNTGVAVHPFSPISSGHSKILILGTMPSVASRDGGFYYAHPRNRFWTVLAGSFGQPVPRSVAEKTELLLTNGVALWDVLASCEISGSDDSSIRNPMYNDIATLVSDRPIEKILCNGMKTYQLCLKLGLSLPVLPMPSTSPANAAWSAELLIDVWKPELL